jgi:Ca-activated chloride channel family protein
LALLGLLLVPFAFLFSRRRRRPAAIDYSALHDLTALPRSVMTRLREALPWLHALVLVLCVAALTRPQQGLETAKVYGDGLAIVMVVDISSSMATPDVALDGQMSNRLALVKQTFRDFVRGGSGLRGRDGDLIGMVTFARYADSVCPLTLDYDTLLSLLDQVVIVPQAEEDGTAIGEAIALGVERLQASQVSSRVMILLTDGTNNAGATPPLQAAQIAEALGVKIYAIGTGNERAIDELTLMEIAAGTGGQYFHATDSEALHHIYVAIDRLETTATVSEHDQQYAERFAWFLLPALGLLLLEMVLVNTRFLSIP